MESSIRRHSDDELARLFNSVNTIAYNDERGEVEYYGEKVIVLKRDTISTIQKQFEKVMGKAARTLIKVAGKSAGVNQGRAILKAAESMGFQRDDHRFLEIAFEGSNMGFGKMRLASIEPGSKSATVEVENCFEAVEYGRSRGPVCFFVAGWLEATFEEFFAAPLKCEELKCTAKGDSNCEFRLTAVDQHATNQQPV